MNKVLITDNIIISTSGTSMKIKSIQLFIDVSFLNQCVHSDLVEGLCVAGVVHSLVYRMITLSHVIRISNQ